MIRKYNIGGPIAVLAPGTSAMEVISPYITSTVSNIARVTPYVAIPAALSAAAYYSGKANQKQVENGMTPFIPNPHAVLGHQQTFNTQTKSTKGPIAENALVLRPEYRTTTIPVDILNTIGYKPVWNAGKDSGDTSQQSGTQTSETTSAGGSNPEPDEKDKKIKELEEKIKQLENKSSTENKPGFKKGLTQGWNFSKKIGSYGLQGVGIGIGGGLVVGVPAGMYYGGKALLELFNNKELENSNSTSNDDATSGFGK